MVRSLICLVLLYQIGIQGQYFGQNKVRYKKLDFKVLKTQHCDLYYYEEESDMAAEAGRMAERWYARLSRVFNHQLSSRQPVILYAGPEDFRSTNVIPGEIGEGTGGVTEPLRRRVVLPLAGPLAETDHVLGHELVHAFQYDISLRGVQGGLEASPMERLPLWFIEGMAEYLSLGPLDPNTAMWMRDAVAQNKLPKIKKLNNPKYFPYRWGQALWAYIEGAYDEKVIGELQRLAGRSGNWNDAFKTVLHKDADRLTEEWHQALKRRYAPVLEETTAPDAQGRLLISKNKNGGGSTLNVSPALSPDGKEMIVFSARDLFSIDLYLADAETGEIKRKLTSTATDPHLDSLEFINSAGAWSYDGKRFAFGEIVKGHPQLAVYDMQKGKSVEHVALPGMAEIYTPTWSPDGKQIAFSALINGQTDLFAVDLGTRKIHRLTNDAFADLQPAWSPDGSSLVFVTDRFHTKLSDLAYGHYQLATMNLDTGTIDPVPGFSTGKHINPQWSGDGKSVYFVSDRDGIANVYRVVLVDGGLSQVTNIQTGVSGITALSPAFSLAAKADRLVYSAFVKADYNIYVLDSAIKLSGEPPSNALESRAAGVLPTARSASDSAVAMLIGDAEIGLPPSGNFVRAAYKPKLQLDYVAAPGIGVGFSSLGNIVAGGTGLYFSDMLGYRSMLVSLETSSFGNTNSFYRNLSGVVAWENQHSRWDWGFVGGQVPFVTGAFAVAPAVVNGQPVVLEQDVTFWELNRQISAIAAYPFSRAQRVEFSAGYTNIGFAASTDNFFISPVDGSLLAHQSQDLPAPHALHLATASAAYVYDTSVFGGTSPVAGQRYRLEMDGGGGSLNYYTALVDYRKYVRLARPISLAGRVIHYGRYGGDADDSRLSDIFLGYSSLVHGYDPNSFSTGECGSNFSSNGRCPVFDHLMGSKIALANAEARVELLGPLGVIPSKPIPPVEAAWFYDAGVAWTGFDKATFLGGSRGGVSSYGTAVRINLLGFAVGEISLTHPNDRPLRNWIWQFSLNPGW
jgi:Tol biopolymer transport system component